jgi:hypothetical protein
VRPELKETEALIEEEATQTKKEKESTIFCVTNDIGT